MKETLKSPNFNGTTSSDYSSQDKDAPFFADLPQTFSSNNSEGGNAKYRAKSGQIQYTEALLGEERQQ